MKLTENKQIWEGYFTYEDGYEVIDQYIDVKFRMELIFNDNSFVGTSTDSESEGFFDKPIYVKGFILDNKISFVVNYPYLYYKNEDGKIITDKKSKHPEIRYFGIYDEITKKYFGTWEMTMYEEEYLGDYIEEIANGEFEIKRVK